MKKKMRFRLPHLLFLMLGLILFASLLTYVVPAGQFATDENGGIIGTQFKLLGANTPVSPWKAVLLILKGVQNSGLVIAMLFVTGGSIGVILETGAIDEVITWAIAKLQDKGVKVLVPVTFILIGLFGAFGGGDQVIALVPIGLLMAKKLHLDPICALAITFFPASVGFATGGASSGLMIPQLLMDLPVYSGFGVRMAVCFVSLIIGCIYTTHYAVRVSKDPANSLVESSDWAYDREGSKSIAEVNAPKLSTSAILIALIFFLQYAVIVYFLLGLGKSHEYIIAVNLIAGILCGFIGKMGQDKVGKAFAKGAEGMGFVAFIVSLASTLSLVMSEGNITHTIVYYATRPLLSLPLACSAIGLSVIIAVINVFIPSASAKAAILFPIVKPITQALGLTPQLAVSAFQYGDGFTNIISPVLGATVGSLDKADVPYNKWVRWAFPCIGMIFLACMAILFILVSTGWNG